MSGRPSVHVGSLRRLIPFYVRNFVRANGSFGRRDFINSVSGHLPLSPYTSVEITVIYHFICVLSVQQPNPYLGHPAPTHQRVFQPEKLVSLRGPSGEAEEVPGRGHCGRYPGVTGDRHTSPVTPDGCPIHPDSEQGSILVRPPPGQRLLSPHPPSPATDSVVPTQGPFLHSHTNRPRIG